MAVERYTLVRHTGFTATAHEDFACGVEERAITEGQAKKIEAAGGFVFFDYTEAEEAAFAENYPPGTEGLTPKVRGAFIKVPGIGESIYILEAARSQA